ncbi:uncharacterized protein LOC132546145 isoform X2 [Ylistrum balloti]|uniref:uncharacterized protein LOC132546145 isoform X2 n=1 Tax=Ylistrum balloti TaxID=509963 RepID=UPI002905D63F|nr:uncharacterized protein LOC132546145 isoform X2 [Ylistrum balloti]
MDKKPKFVAAIKIGHAYSGYAYSFDDEFTQNPFKIGISSWHSSARHTSLKTSSAILCQPDRKFHSFGYTAEDRYSNLGEEANQWFYFSTFPTYAQLDETSEMTDVTGQKSMLTLDLYTMAIRFLRKSLAEKLHARLSKLDETDINWILVTQRSYNAGFISKAAEQAGITQNVTVRTKMNSALTYLECSSLFNGQPFTTGEKFLVLDAAASSVELLTCRNENGNVVTTNTITITGGGNVLNNGIKSLIETVLGVDDLSVQDDIRPLIKEIECKKKTIKPGSRETLVLQLPARYKDAKPVNKRIEGKTIPGLLDDADFDGKVKLKNGKVHIEFEVIEGIFMACARDLVSLLRKSQQCSELKEVSSIVMIGGYSSSAFLKNEIIRAFQEIKVHTLFESSIADLKGAVIFGHSKGALEISDSVRFSREKIQHYIKTLQDQTEKARNIRIIIVGQEHVGKTSLCKRLLNENDDVIDAITSTDGIEIYIQRFLIDMVTKKRIKLDANTETQNVRTRIQQLLLLNKLSDNVEDLSTDEVQEQQVTLEKEPEHRTSVIAEETTPQTKKLPDTMTPPLSAKSPVLERIKYWIRSAVNYSEKKNPRKCFVATPPVILVGTRLDKLSGTKEEIQQHLDKFEEKLCGMADFQAMKGHIYGFFEVNNKVRNHPGIEQLWNAIIEVAPSQSQWEKELPARWLTLEREMMRMKETGEKVMSFEDIVSLGRRCEVEINDETDIHMFLKYLHYTGSILYFGDETENLGLILAKTVILDPQWVAQAFRKIITVPKFVNRKDKRANFLWKMYQQSAILDMEYLQIVWNEERQLRLWEYREVILAFMERLGLIARPNHQQRIKSAGDGSGPEESDVAVEIYLVPSLLSGKVICFPREMTDRYAIKTRTLCLVFSSRCVQFPVFDKLLAACIEKFKVMKTEDEIWLRRGFGIFRIDSVWSVVISCGNNIIKITLFKQSPVPTIEPGAGLRVRLFIEEALKNIMELYDHRDLNFAYHLHCKAIVKDGDVTVPKTELEQRKLLPCCLSEGDKHFVYRHELHPWFSEARPPLMQDEYDEEYNLASEVLERCPTEVEMLRLSKLIGLEYFEFFVWLGLESTAISLVNIEYQSETMCARFLHMFVKWKKAESDKATIRRIMDAMKKSGLDTSEVVRKGVFDTAIHEF